MLEGAERWAGWDAYHLESVKDEPITEVIDLINALRVEGHEIVAFTARPAKFRAMTMSWFVEHGVMIDDIMMRADDDYRPAVEIKTALSIERFGENLRDKVCLVIEDREDVCAAFMVLGVTCLQVNAVRRRRDARDEEAAGVAPEVEGEKSGEGEGQGREVAREKSSIRAGVAREKSPRQKGKASLRPAVVRRGKKDDRG